MVEQSRTVFNINTALDTLQVVSETIFPANLLTEAKTHKLNNYYNQQ